MKKPTVCIYCGSRHVTRDLEDEHYICLKCGGIQSLSNEACKLLLRRNI